MLAGGDVLTLKVGRGMVTYDTIKSRGITREKGGLNLKKVFSNSSAIEVDNLVNHYIVFLFWLKILD